MRRLPSARRPRTPAWPSRRITAAVGATEDGDAGGGPATTTTTTGIAGPTTAMATTGMVTIGDIAGSSTAGAAGIEQRSLPDRRCPGSRWAAPLPGQRAPVRHRGTRRGRLLLCQCKIYKIRGRFAPRAGPGDLRRDVRARGSRGREEARCAVETLCLQASRCLSLPLNDT